MLNPNGRELLKRIALYTSVTIAACWILAPIIISLLYGFASPEDYYDKYKVIPLHFTFKHVYELLFVLDSFRAVLNSLAVALGTIALSFLLGLPAGYALAKFVFPGKDTLKLLIVVTRMFPIMVIAVPLTVLYIRIGLSDTLIGLVLAHTAMSLPFVVLITSSIFAGIPTDYEEAAMVFGLSRVSSFLRITLPLALPGLAATAMFTFIISWNEVFIASVLMLVNRTLPAHILTMVTYGCPDYYKFAAISIMVLPAMSFVLIARKYLISMWGITIR